MLICQTQTRGGPDTQETSVCHLALGGCIQLQCRLLTSKRAVVRPTPPPSLCSLSQRWHHLQTKAPILKKSQTFSFIPLLCLSRSERTLTRTVYVHALILLFQSSTLFGWEHTLKESILYNWALTHSYMSLYAGSCTQVGHKGCISKCKTKQGEH